MPHLVSPLPRLGGRARFENCHAGVLARGQFGALAGAARGGGAISIRVGVLARHLLRGFGTFRQVHLPVTCAINEKYAKRVGKSNIACSWVSYWVVKTSRLSC